MGLDEKVVKKLDNIIKRSRPLHRGDYLFRKGDKLRSLFVIKTGSVKTTFIQENGHERVVGFYLSSEMVGLDAIQKNEYICSAKVLETSAICEIPFWNLEELTANVPALQHQMYRLMSREINYEMNSILMIGKKTAEEKLAAFLLNLSARFKNRGLSATDFYLSMSRYDISNYLGLAIETVSRLFTRFQEEGLLQVERRHVKLLNVQHLEIIVSSTHSFKFNSTVFPSQPPQS